MKKLLLIGVICILISLGAYTWMKETSRTPSATNQPNTSNLTNSDNFISSTPDTTNLRMGGSSFRDPNNVYSFLYPNDYQLLTDDPLHIRIIKQGPTQQGQTELYDGVLVVFESIDLQGQNLESFVDSRIQQSTADGTSEVIQPKKDTFLNSYSGFTYTMRGLGETTYLVLQKSPESDSAVSITFLVADPENQGFQTEVDAILSTLELH